MMINVARVRNYIHWATCIRVKFPGMGGACTCPTGYPKKVEA